MKVLETVVMKIGKTKNGHVIRTKMAESILHLFDGIPIVLNKDQNFKDYASDDFKERYDKLPVVGHVIGNAKIVGKKIVADIEMKDEYAAMWRGSADNWLVEADVKEKEIIISKILSIEIFDSKKEE